MLDPLDKQPVWMREAKTRPILQSVGDDMTAMLPHDLLTKIMKQKANAEETAPEGAGDKPGPDAAPDQTSPERRLAGAACRRRATAAETPVEKSRDLAAHQGFAGNRARRDYLTFVTLGVQCQSRVRPYGRSGATR